MFVDEFLPKFDVFVCFNLFSCKALIAHYTEQSKRSFNLHVQSFRCNRGQHRPSGVKYIALLHICLCGSVC